VDQTPIPDMTTDTSRPKLRLFCQSAGGWYPIDLARGRPTNPARIPVGPWGRWYDMAARLKALDLENRELRQANDSPCNASAYFAQAASTSDTNHHRAHH